MTLTIRAWQDDDQLTTLPVLSAGNPDALWRDQFQSLHGPNHEQPFRRTLIAERDGTLVGVATLAERSLHPQRDACAIDVHPAFRRQGVGSALLGSLRELHPMRFPVMTKHALTTVSLPAIHFLAAHRATVYQVVPGFTIDLDRATSRPGSAHPLGITITSMRDIPPETIELIFVAMYHWTHEHWNPVSSRAELQTAARREVTDVDPALSSIAWRNGEAVAAVFVFPGNDGEAEIAAETVHRDAPDGHRILNAALQHAIECARAAGFRRLLFDGHVSDPHLYPIVDRLATDRLPDLGFFTIPR